MINYLYPSDIVYFSKTCRFIHKMFKDKWMQKMTCFHDVSEGWASNRHVIDQHDHHNKQDLCVSHYPFNQLDVSVRYGSCPWHCLHFHYLCIKQFRIYVLIRWLGQYYIIQPRGTPSLQKHATKILKALELLI